jgi:hypothetical protein
VRRPREGEIPGRSRGEILVAELIGDLPQGREADDHEGPGCTPIGGRCWDFAEEFARGGVVRGMDTIGPQQLSPIDLRARLGLLELERAAAEQSPLANDPRYMADLFAEIDAIQATYVGTVVIEIARLRGDLDGQLYG